VESFKALYAVTAQLQRIKFSGDCSEAATRKLADLIAKHCELLAQRKSSRNIIMLFTCPSSSSRMVSTSTALLWSECMR